MDYDLDPSCQYATHLAHMAKWYTQNYGLPKEYKKHEPKAGQFSDETISDWRESFSLFDKNRDGVICCSELGSVIRSIGQTPTNDDVKKMITDADKDGNGTVDFDEFVAMMARYYSTMDPEKEMRDAFRVFDKDGNGYISKSELKSVMHSLGEQLNDQEIEEMILAADADKDGAINYSEFVKMVCQAK